MHLLLSQFSIYIPNTPLLSHSSSGQPPIYHKYVLMTKLISKTCSTLGKFQRGVLQDFEKSEIHEVPFFSLLYSFLAVNKSLALPGARLNQIRRHVAQKIGKF